MEMGYYGNDGFIVGWDIDVIFLRRTKLGDRRVF